MIDKYLAKLIATDSGTSLAALAALEQDIWRREASQCASRRTSRALASWQAVVIALGIFGSAAVGMAAAANLQLQAKPLRLNSGEEMAPSTLLFGNQK